MFGIKRKEIKKEKNPFKQFQKHRTIRKKNREVRRISF